MPCLNPEAICCAPLEGQPATSGGQRHISRARLCSQKPQIEDVGVRCAADALCKLVREAEGFGMNLARDRIGAALGSRAAAAKAWLDRTRKARSPAQPASTFA